MNKGLLVPKVHPLSPPSLVLSLRTTAQRALPPTGLGEHQAGKETEGRCERKQTESRQATAVQILRCTETHFSLL